MKLFKSSKKTSNPLKISRPFTFTRIGGSVGLSPSLRTIGGSEGLSPSLRLIPHPVYGGIVTSNHDIIRFTQGWLPVCYNAALATYMYSTQSSGGTYTEYKYHDKHRGPSMHYDQQRANFEDLYSNRPIRPFHYKKEKLDWYKTYGNGELFLNARENNLTAKAHVDMYPNTDDPNAFYKCVQTFERILSYGPVIACSKVTKELLPHYFNDGLNNVHMFHAYLIYGIIKYIANNKLEAVFICVDPNYPGQDTLIPIQAFIESPLGHIISKDAIQIRLNKELLPINLQDLKRVNTPLATGTLDNSGKRYKFYKYMNGPSPRIIGSMTRSTSPVWL